MEFTDGTTKTLVDDWTGPDSTRIPDHEELGPGFDPNLHWTGETRFQIIDRHRPAIRLRTKTSDFETPRLRDERRRREDRTRHEERRDDDIRFPAVLRGDVLGDPAVPRASDPQNETEDYWARNGFLWIRYHVVPRARLFIPTERDPTGPNLERLRPQRITHFVRADRPGDATQLRRDEWNTEDDAANQQDMSTDLGGLWTGRTVFEEIVDDPDLNEPEHTDAANRPKAVRQPLKPTFQEKRLHRLTHLPFSIMV